MEIEVFTDPACKMSGMKDARTRLQTIQTIQTMQTMQTMQTIQTIQTIYFPTL